MSALVSAVGTSTVASSAAGGGEAALLLLGLDSAGTAASAAVLAGASVEVAMVVGIKLEISRGRVWRSHIALVYPYPIPDRVKRSGTGFT